MAVSQTIATANTMIPSTSGACRGEGCHRPPTNTGDRFWRSTASLISGSAMKRSRAESTGSAWAGSSSQSTWNPPSSVMRWVTPCPFSQRLKLARFTVVSNCLTRYTAYSASGIDSAAMLGLARNAVFAGGIVRLLRPFHIYPDKLVPGKCPLTIHPVSHQPPVLHSTVVDARDIGLERRRLTLHPVMPHKHRRRIQGIADQLFSLVLRQYPACHFRCQWIWLEYHI